MSQWTPGLSQVPAETALPAPLVWVRGILFLLATFQVLMAVGMLLGGISDAPSGPAAALGAAVVAVLLLAGGVRMDQAGPRRLPGIVALGIFEILTGLSRAAAGDLSGVLVAVLAVAMLTLVTRRSSQAYLRGR